MSNLRFQMDGQNVVLRQLYDGRYCFEITYYENNKGRIYREYISKKIFYEMKDFMDEIYNKEIFKEVKNE